MSDGAKPLGELSRVVLGEVADITPQNANVYFEVGYAFALNKPIILLAEKPTDLPFDISAFRVLSYEDSIAGKTRVEQGLERHLRAILGTPKDDEQEA